MTREYSNDEFWKVLQTQKPKDPFPEFTIIKMAVTAKTRKLSARWTIEYEGSEKTVLQENTTCVEGTAK